MIAIKILKNGVIEDLRASSAYETIQDICKQHKEEQRALAFAFIIHNFKDPQLNKVLSDEDYWESLDKISGHLLTVFYLPSNKKNFGEDLLISSGSEQRGMYGINVDESKDMMVPMIKNYLQYDRPIKLPTVLFFQTDGRLIQDFFFIELSEQKIEDSFNEIKTYISGAVNELERVRPENYGNSQEIFNLLKSGVKAVNFKRRVNKTTGSFPFQQFIGWLIG